MLSVAVSVWLTGCVSQTVRSVDMTPPREASKQIAESDLLDVGVAVWDPNIPEDYDVQVKEIITPDIRRAEANFMAFTQKQVLQSTGNWGAVRVIPQPSNAVDVVVKGKIIKSDGERLIVQVKVTDATGTVWFDNRYEAIASKYAYDDSVPVGVDAFQPVYRRVADDMLNYRLQLTDEDVLRIRTMAEMRFARDFSPDAFDNYITESNKGKFTLKRLPAEGDPMLARVKKVREREYLFIDTLDEYYTQFDHSMSQPYTDWRRATYDEAVSMRELRAQSRARMLAGTVAILGGVAGQYKGDSTATAIGGTVGVIAGATLLKSAIAKKAEAQIHADVLEELGNSAEAELTPHTIELENQTVRLSGTVEEQYQEFRRILRKLYYEDMGLPPPVETPATEATEPVSE